MPVRKPIPIILLCVFYDGTSITVCLLLLCPCKYDSCNSWHFDENGENGHYVADGDTGYYIDHSDGTSEQVFDGYATAPP
ncbi:hypothetical protein KIPB_009593 [Kipferlia bialata]|uniref:Uncharacterized protein n=1 Tax=Kipferlia bialata TaxID=797122 RepID=A0A391NNZ6_9EUKA|nr:hypothetical protein KIPB_009593 [Kipferlia bialata]|eukprot:g9593.t1